MENWYRGRELEHADEENVPQLVWESLSGMKLCFS